MSGTARFFLLAKKEPKRLENGFEVDTTIDKLYLSRFRIAEYLQTVPDIRRDKVTDLRQRIISGSWNPTSKRVAEKILHEHLFDSAHL